MGRLERKLKSISLMLFLLMLQIPFYAIVKDDERYYDTVNVRKKFFLHDEFSWETARQFSTVVDNDQKKVGVVFVRRRDGYDWMFYPAYRGEKDNKTYGKIVYRFSSQRELEKVKVHYLENNDTYILFEKEGEAQHFTVYLFGEKQASGIEFNFDIDKLMYLPFQSILTAVDRRYPLTKVLIQKEDQKIKENFINRVILPSASEFLEDGARNEFGENVFISTLKPVPRGKRGLNCSGYVKEIFDNYLCYIRPGQTRLRIEPLKRRNGEGENPFREQHRKYEYLEDPFFGKDWVENLNQQFNSLSGILSEQALEIREDSHLPYYENRGFKLSDLPFIIYRDQIKNSLCFYIVVFNKYKNHKVLIPKYYHMAVIVPYSSGKHFYFRVFESGEETNFDLLIRNHIPVSLPVSAMKNILENRVKTETAKKLLEKSYVLSGNRRTYMLKQSVSTEEAIRLSRVFADVEYEEEKVLVYRVPISFHFYQ